MADWKASVCKIGPESKGRFLAVPKIISHMKNLFENYFPISLSFQELCIDRLSGPVSRDTARLSQRYPPIARYGAFGVSTWPIGCDTPSPFSERFSLGEHVKWRCDTPPLQRGVSQRYLRDTLWKQGNWVRYPPLRYYLERVLRDMGAHWAAKFTGIGSPQESHQLSTIT